MTRVCTYFLIILSVLVSKPVSGVSPVQHSGYIQYLSKLVPVPDNRGGGGSFFGESISVANEVAVIGAPGAAGHGVVYVYERMNGQWNLVQELNPPNQTTNSVFGTEVFVTTEFLFVASDVVDSGAVHVFSNASGSWTEVQVLIPSDGSANDLFGRSISRSGDHLAIGASSDDRLGMNDVGAVYTYFYDGQDWQYKQKIEPSDSAEDDYFGGSVSVSGDVLMIGANGHDQGGINAGAVYEFFYDGQNWQAGQKLLASDSEDFQGFGVAVDLEGDRLAVGSSSGSDGAQGSVYVVQHNGQNWLETHEITAGDLNNPGLFGLSLKLQGDRLLVSAPWEQNSSGDRVGESFVFDYDGMNWNLLDGMVDPNPQTSQRFGQSLAMAGDQVLLGANFDQTVGEDAGAVYVFDEQPGDWIQSQQITNGPSASGHEFGEVMAADGGQLLIGAPSADGFSGAVTHASFDGQAWQVVDVIAAQNPGQNQFGIQVAIDQNHAFISEYDSVVHHYELIQGTLQYNQTLQAAQPDKMELFGHALAVEGDRLVIGDPGWNPGELDHGAAYVFELVNDQWIETQFIEPQVNDQRIEFGREVLINGDRIMVSAPYLNSGAVFYYEFDGMNWIEQQLISAQSAHPFSLFGTSMSMDNDRLVVAANASSSVAPVVFMFEYDGSQWNQVQHVIPADGRPLLPDVSLQGDQLVVGNQHWFESIGSDDRFGAFYLFQYINQNWIESDLMIPADGFNNSGFGKQVILDGNNIFVSSPRDNDSGKNSGSVYLYQTDDLIYTDGFDG
jgi:hypothetical protein